MKKYKNKIMITIKIINKIIIKIKLKILINHKTNKVDYHHFTVSALQINSIKIITNQPLLIIMNPF